MKTSDLFVKALEIESVKYIYCIPGEENLDFLDSLRGSTIQLVELFSAQFVDHLVELDQVSLGP